MTATRALRRHGLTAAAVEVAEEGLVALAAAPLPLWSSLAASTTRREREAELLAAAGQLEEAREAFLEVIGIRPDDPALLARVGIVEARLGMEAEARARTVALEALGGDSPRWGDVTASRAAIHAELGDEPHLVRLLLEQSHWEGRSLASFHFTPHFDPVWDHPDVRDFFVRPRAPDAPGS